MEGPLTLVAEARVLVWLPSVTQSIIHVGGRSGTPPSAFGSFPLGGKRGTELFRAFLTQRGDDLFGELLHRFVMLLRG